MNHYWIVVAAISKTMIEHSYENHAWVRFLSSGDSSRFFLGGTLALIFPSFLTDFSWHASSYFSSFWLIFHWLQEAFPRRWLKSGSGKNPFSQRLSHSCTLELIIRYRLKVIEDILCSFHTFALSKEPFIPILLSARAAPWKTYLGVFGVWHGWEEFVGPECPGEQGYLGQHGQTQPEAGSWCCQEDEQVLLQLQLQV